MFAQVPLPLLGSALCPVGVVSLLKTLLTSQPLSHAFGMRRWPMVSVIPRTVFTFLYYSPTGCGSFLKPWNKYTFYVEIQLFWMFSAKELTHALYSIISRMTSWFLRMLIFANCYSRQIFTPKILAHHTNTHIHTT